MKEGIPILMISSELPEILGMSDRVYVMHEESISAGYSRGQATQEKILEAPWGNLSRDRTHQEASISGKDERAHDHLCRDRRLLFPLCEKLFSASNAANIIRQASVLAIVAFGQTFAIIIQGFDLSVGPVMGLYRCVTALLMIKGMVPVVVAVDSGAAGRHVLRTDPTEWSPTTSV